MIEFSGVSRDPILSQELISKFKNSEHKILVLDWWELIGKYKHSHELFEKASELVKKYDICFFIVREELVFYIDIYKIKKLLDELNKLNVFYLTLSTDSRVSTATSKTYNIPWFVLNSENFYISKNTTIDFDYRQKDYTFNMLLGVDKHYRTLLFELLRNEQYIYSTYFGHKEFRPFSSTHLEDNDVLDNFYSQDVSSSRLETMQHVRRGGRNICLSHNIPEKIYNNSHFDIVTESLPLENGLHFTSEKTGKPLSTGRFFIWYNSANTVEYLRQFGFELQDYLSEYDGIKCNIDRMAAVNYLIREIGDNENYIKKIYKDTKEARMYNQEVFKKLSTTTKSDINSWMAKKINRSTTSEKTNA